MIPKIPRSQVSHLFHLELINGLGSGNSFLVTDISVPEVETSGSVVPPSVMCNVTVVTKLASRRQSSFGDISTIAFMPSDDTVLVWLLQKL